MISYGGCFFAEPFVRLACQALGRRWSTVIWTFVHTEEGETWTARIGIAALFFLLGASCISNGAYYHKYWMIWLGGGFLVACCVWLLIDFYNGYTRRFARWSARRSPSREDHIDEEVEFEYLG